MLIDDEDYTIVKKIVEELQARAKYLTDDLCLADCVDIPTRMSFNVGQLNQINSLLDYIKALEDELKAKKDKE